MGSRAQQLGHVENNQSLVMVSVMDGVDVNLNVDSLKTFLKTPIFLTSPVILRSLDLVDEASKSSEYTQMFADS